MEEAEASGDIFGIEKVAKQTVLLEDGPLRGKWLVGDGSPSFISHEKVIWKGSHNPNLRGLTIT